MGVSNIIHGLVDFLGRIVRRKSSTSRFDKYKNRGKTVEIMRRRRAVANEMYQKEKRFHETFKFLQGKCDVRDEMNGIVDSFEIHKAMKEITAGDSKCQVLAIQKLKSNIIREEGRHLVDLIMLESGLVPFLITLVKYDNYSYVVECEVVEMLKILTSGSSAQIDDLIKCGCIPALNRLLSCDVTDICGETIWALGNIVTDRLKPMDKDVIGEFVAHLPPLDPTCTQLPIIRAFIRRVPKKSRDGIGIDENFVRLVKKHVCFKAFGDKSKVPNDDEFLTRIKTGDKSIKDLDLRALFIKVDDFILCETFTLSDLPFIRAVVWAMSVLKEKISPGNEKVYLPALVKCLTIAEHDELIFEETCESLRTIDDKSNDDIIENVVRSGVIPKLIDKFDAYDIGIVNCAIRAVAIIATGTQDHTQALIDEKALPALSIVLNFPQINLQRETARCLERISNKNERQKLAVVESRLLTKLLRKFERSDEIVQQFTLKILFNLCYESTPEIMTQLIKSEAIQAMCKLINGVDLEKRALFSDLLTFCVTSAEKCELLDEAVAKIKQNIIAEKLEVSNFELNSMGEIVKNLRGIFAIFADRKHLQQQLCVRFDAYFANEVLDASLTTDIQLESVNVPGPPVLVND